MPSEAAGLFLHDAGFSYPGGFALHHINLLVNGGEMVALLGPNGSGKTTLLKLATGVITPAEGEVQVGGKSLGNLSRKQVAQRMAVVPQQFTIPFAYTVEEIVMLGRTPFVRGFLGEAKRDKEIVSLALELTGMTGFRDRFFNDLSGGERQKAVLAMSLAQEPTLLLLDEPTAHLDINHQVEIMELLRKLNREKKITVIAAMHDLNLAALYFERLVLLDRGSIYTDGSPETVITREIIQSVFSATVAVGRHPTALVPQVTILPSNNQSN
jgi:iron complex transport system ATP-binding protein